MMPRTRLSATVALVGILSIALIAHGAAQDPPDVTTLVPGTEVERRLAGGQQHLFQLALEAGDYASLTVEQRGIDVSVQLDGADGMPIAEFQEEIRTHGEEHVEVVADVSGTFTLTVKAVLRNAPLAAYAIRIADTRPATDADRAMQEARRLRRAAVSLHEAGKPEQAQPLLERALTIAERVRGRDDVDVAALVGALAQIHEARHDYAKAEALHQRALTAVEKTWGPEHPMTAAVLSRLGSVYEQLGDRRKAEAALQRALEISEKRLGPEHPQVARCLTTLASLRDDAGDAEKAEELILRAMRITENTRGTENLAYAGLLNNLGLIYKSRTDYERAEDLLRRSLAIKQRLGLAENSLMANALQNIGNVARQRGDFATAEEYVVRALSIREKIVGPEHSDIAANLNDLGMIYSAQGNPERALKTFLRTLSIWEKAQGPYGAGTLLALGNTARTYSAIGDTRNAIVFQRRVDAVLEKQLALNVAIGSERQKLASVSSVSGRMDRTLSLGLITAPEEPDASMLAATVLLQRKGRVLDAMSDTLGILRQRLGTAEDRDLLDQLRKTTARLAQVALDAPRGTSREDRLKAIKELEDQKEKLEAAISERSVEFRVQSEPVTLDAVQAAMPADSALIEFVVFRPFDPKAANSSTAYGDPHYAAYIIRRDGPPRGQDLGPAKSIDEVVDAFREALRDPRRDAVKPLARAVDERVMQPIRSTMGVATRLLISPDGELNLIPFEALIDQHGHYLIERYSVSYLTSGRDLLRMQAPRMSRREPVLVADPLFGEPPKGDHPNAALASARSARRSVTAADDMSSMYFAPLSGTSLEARGIKSLFPESTVLTGGQATKAALEQVDAPSILHIATHGFFVQGTHGSANPLLRSGLALAGANLRRDAHNDGILTASEVSGLNLWGTQLVTLSACQTGVGEVKNREGVYGVRRAIFLAGAETLVMSLWAVSDSVTREMMTAYYTGLKNGLGRGEALRQVQLGMLTHKNREHPFYWASFIQAGDWRRLDGPR